MIPWWFWLWLIALLVVVFLLYWTRRMSTPYRLYMVFGRKGSGKSTYMQKLAYQYYKKGYKVFSNADIQFASKIDISLLGHFVAPEKSVLFIDEVGMIWDNRNFKAFRTDVRDYFKLQRHYRNIVYLFSQTFDVDVKLRVLTDAMYLITRPLPPLTCIRKIKRTIVLVQPTPDAEGRIADSLEFVPWWLSIFGAKTIQFLWLPKWIKMFDSFQRPELPLFPYSPRADAEPSYRQPRRRASAVQNSPPPPRGGRFLRLRRTDRRSSQEGKKGSRVFAFCSKVKSVLRAARYRKWL